MIPKPEDHYGINQTINWFLNAIIRDLQLILNMKTKTRVDQTHQDIISDNGLRITISYRASLRVA